MTTEYILLLGLFAFILGGVLLGDRGPVATFQKSGPRLGAVIERDVSVGKVQINGQFAGFQKPTGEASIMWSDPNH